MSVCLSVCSKCPSAYVNLMLIRLLLNKMQLQIYTNVLALWLLCLNQGGVLASHIAFTFTFNLIVVLCMKYDKRKQMTRCLYHSHSPCLFLPVYPMCPVCPAYVCVCFISYAVLCSFLLVLGSTWGFHFDCICNNGNALNGQQHTWIRILTNMCI